MVGIPSGSDWLAITYSYKSDVKYFVCVLVDYGDSLIRRAKSLFVTFVVWFVQLFLFYKNISIKDMFLLLMFYVV